jgi:uncharacterized protein (TIGR02687 family)
MDERSIASLKKLFDRYRIVFWYDDKSNLREDFEALELDGVTKVEIDNNEFSLKYRMLREEPKTKFLLYHEGPRPDDEHNWLLDVFLYQGEFHTDQSAIILSELNLDPKFLNLIEHHMVFFENKNRVNQLKKQLSHQETLQDFQLKLLAVCCGTESEKFDYALMALLEEASIEEDDRMHTVERCGLSAFLWSEVKRRYGYASTEVGITDFAFELFASAFASETGDHATLSRAAGVFLKQWKDSKTFSSGYGRYSGQCAEQLNIADKLTSIEFRQLIDCDLFEVIDRHIIKGILAQVKDRTVNDEQVNSWIRKRRTLHWHDTYRHHYDALIHASRFLTLIPTLVLSIQGMGEGVRLYSTTLSEVDRLYRKYLLHVGKADASSLFADLTKDVENHYNNTFLLPLSSSWHDAIEREKRWDASPVPLQRNFFTRHVNRENKVCVIISDALRYEVADELTSLINGEDRFTAEIEPMLSMLPSYTQLGMASLLPNKELVIGDKGIVSVDGASSMGKANRDGILKKALDGKASAVDAESILNMKVEDCKPLVRDNQVLYVYHNVIDKVGDDRDSEEKVFTACEEALDDLQKLVRKLSSANANNIIITADHGFLYQNNVLDDSDFVGLPVLNEGAFLTDRRFLVGTKLKDNSSMIAFTASQLHLGGNYEIQIPRGINRLRVKGSGSRYVHGGATLQEVVIPVVKINKKRQGDVSFVSVSVLTGTSNRITSGQLGVTFYQNQPISAKVKSLRIRAGIYTADDVLISEQKELLFDFTSEHARDRENRVRFLFANTSEAMRSQKVELRLEVPIENTSKWKPYIAYPYMLDRKMGTDF